jgi:fucose permease
MLLALSPAAMAIFSALAGRLLKRFSAHQICRTGAALLITGLAGIGCWSSTPDFLLISLSLLSHGAGLGLLQVATLDWIMGLMPRNAQGVAGSLVMLTRTIGAVMGVSACFTWFQWLAGTGGVGFDTVDRFFIDAFSGTFRAAAAIAGASFGLLMLVRSGDR